MPQDRLPESRLAQIEKRARDRGTLSDRVVCELVEEIRRLRRVLAEGLSAVGSMPLQPQSGREPRADVE